MSISIILWLMVAHYFADFVCQTPTMGLKKSSDETILLLHVMTYGAVLSVFCLFIGLPDPWVFAFTNAIMHWAVDWVTSRMTKYFYEQDNMMMFWKVIGLDQLLHALCLLWTYYLTTAA